MSGSKREAMDIDALIDGLSDEIKAVKVMAHPFKRAIPWIIISLLYLSVSIGLIGFRPDIGIKIGDANFVFEIILVLAMSIKAGLCAIWLCVPDMRGQKWMLAVPVSLFLSFIVWTGLRVLLEPMEILHMHWHTCYTAFIVFGAIPALMIFILSMAGRTTHPYILSGMNTLAVGGLGYIGLRLVCMSEDIGHALAYHILPFAVLGLVSSIIGRKIYHW